MGYITPADVRNFIRNDEYDDTQLQPIIDRISSYVDDVIGHTAGSPVTVTRYFDGNGTNRLMISPSPVVSVTEVKFYDGTEWKPYDVSAIDIVDEKILQLRYSPNHPLSYFPEGDGNISVTFTYGYQTVPAWIKEYVLLRVVEELVPGEYSEALQRAEEAFNKNALI